MKIGTGCLYESCQCNCILGRIGEAEIAQWYRLRYGLDDRGFESRQGLGTASRPTLEPTQLLIQWVPGALSLGVKRAGREADHLPPSSAEVKNAWIYTSTPQYAFMAWFSVKAQGHLYLYRVGKKPG
jgi:hypothetical protein